MDNKVTVIGFTGSGKTTYLTGMYIRMSRGVKHFSLVAKDHSMDLYLEKLWDMICDGQEPDPSNKLETYDFHIAHNRKPVCDFEWLDYPGGLLIDTLSENRQRLENDIKSSDCLLLIIDGKLLSDISAMNAEDYQQKLEEKLIYDKGIRSEDKIFTRLSDAGIELPPIGIIVTKCDLIAREYQEAIQKALRKGFEDLYEASGRIVLQMSVSLGGAIEKGFSPAPYCIEQPIAFAALSILMKYIAAAQMQKNANKQYINTHSGFLSRIFNSDNIARAKDNVQNLGVVVDKWSADAFKLIELFSERKIIYVDGREQNLRDYYRNIFAQLSE